MSKLVKEFPLGVQVTFRHNVERWQQNQVTTMMSSPQLVSSPKPNSDKNNVLELVEILDCTQGTMIMDYYKINKSLNDNIRTLLVEIIIQNIITKKIVMSVSLAENISNQIQGLFPSELKV